MPAVYLPDVPEFRPVIQAFASLGLKLQRAGGYVQASSTEAIELPRTAVPSMQDATWFGIAVGGIEGDLVRHDLQAFRLE